MKHIQSQKSPHYSGNNNLEIMQIARNYNSFIANQILSLAPDDKHIKAYDFGAGTGQFTTIWRQFRKNKVDVSAIELDPDYRAVLRRKSLKIVNVENINKNSADLIYSVNVLEHIENDQEIFNLFFKKLKPGGRLFLYVPAFQFLWTKMDDAVGHVRRYQRQDLEQKLILAGFEIENIEYADSAGFFATLIAKCLIKGNGDLRPRLLLFFDRVLFPLGRLMDKLVLKHLFGKNLSVLAKKM